VTTLAAGDHVIPLYIPECRACEFRPPGKTNLCGRLRETQALGLMPDRTTVSPTAAVPCIITGTSTFAEYTVVPEIALAKIRSDAPLETVCLLGCGVTTRIGAVLHTARSSPAPASPSSGSAGSVSP
jgi:S-(hydroxymethyl)glutathione dehydrogenase/alcohol dehydrogenase